jgi:tRNA threonylcarbamoyladenosine biosynthesis protein TsaE
MTAPTLDIATPEAQERLGAALAAACPRPFVIFLEGDLGAGKTTLVRGFLRALGQGGPVRSPTFTLLEPYELPGGPIFHLDLYRLADPEELAYLGLRDLVGGRSILLVEWPERGRGELPPPDLRIRIEHLADGRRVRLEAVTPEGAAAVAAATSQNPAKEP